MSPRKDQFLGQAGKGKGWRKNGINVLHLKGGYGEMAGQHGALIRDDVLAGAVPYLGRKNSKLIEQSYLFRDRPMAQKVFKSFINLMQKPMNAQVPHRYKEESYHMHRATGLPWDLIQQTSLQADSLVLMMRYSMGRFLIRELAKQPQFAGIPGCTSVVALKEHTRGGGVLHARNMDYPAVGHWDNHPTVFYCDPEHGQRSVGISTAGIHTVGVTSVNESGLALSAHFHCSRNVSLFGTPVHIIGSEMMRRARNLGEAIDVVNHFDRAGSWSFVVSSARENRAAVIEMVHGDMVVRDADDTDGLMVNTNMFRSPTLQNTEILLSASAAYDFEHRYTRAMDMLRSFSKTTSGVNVKACARILADHFDKELNTVRSQSATISVVTTVTSMITELEQNRFWVAHSGESPVCLGDYSGFKLDETFENFGERKLPIMDWTQPHDGLAHTSIRGTQKHEAYRHFRAAYMSFHNDHDYEATLKNLQKAAELDSGEGNYWLAIGHVAMRLDLYDVALPALKKAIACPLSLHMRQTAELFTAHAYDATGDREGATSIYRRLVSEETVSPHVRKEAEKCLKRAFKAGQARNITFDFQYCDSFEYP